MKKVVIIGAGPAGLTAAYELLDKSHNYEVTVIEEDNIVGGISKTINYKGNRMDMGGHRFFSKSSKVNDWWEKMLPTMGSLPFDDLKLNRNIDTNSCGPDPEIENNVMLKRKRSSRILFNNRFFDYPISLKINTFKNMGIKTSFLVGLSYIKSSIFKREEKSLEDFYINRFGKKLYQMFFENYTENLWGRHPRTISPDWGAQRVKGLSVKKILGDALFKTIPIKKSKKIETSLIEEFLYPKFGPGQLWEITAEKIKEKKGTILLESKVVSLKKIKNSINEITYKKNDKFYSITADYVISSMPLKDLIIGLNNVPKSIRYIAQNLPYRDFITVGVLTKKINLKNNTKIKTINNIVPDNWIYVHNRDVKMCRFQIFNNWSPYMVKDIENSIWIGLEYTCNENDKYWNLSDDDFAKKSIEELKTLKIIENEDDIIDFHVERIKKAYPAYFDTYDRIDELKNYLNKITNLYCIGRNGQHKYNNLDHSMMCAFEAVDNIINDVKDKTNIWNVNTEKEYLE